MDLKILTFGALLFLSFNAFCEERYYAVPTQSLENLSLINRPVIEKSMAGLSMVKMNQEQITELSRRLHETHLGCGGYADLSVTMEEIGVTAEEALQMEITPVAVTPSFDKRDPSYPAEAQKLVGMTNPERMWKFLAQLVVFPNRSAYSKEGVQASQWLASYASKLAQDHGRTDVQILTFPTGGVYKQPSVAVLIPGTNRKLPGVILGGHMDTYENTKPGADDDGSGTATVMEVYNAVLDSGMHFQRDLYFAFYAAEERGLVGSRVMAAEFKKRGIPLRAVLQFDMTGFKSPKDDKEIYMIDDHVNMDLTHFVAKLAEVYAGLPVKRVSTTTCGYSCSDHASWTSNGYNSAFPFEASFENYNHTLHTPQDKMDIMSMDHAAYFLKTGAAFVVETADPVN